MQVLKKVRLRNYSTMRLGGVAKYLAEINSVDDLEKAITWANEKEVPIIMIGEGSNIVWRDEGYGGLVLVNKIRGFETSDITQDEILATVGAGEDWDSVVERITELGFSGIECLSLIPGTAGATPIQNVGAYGSEISKSLVSVQAYDKEQMKMVTIANKDCGFGYRTSRFKKDDKGKFFITAITLRLTKAKPNPPFYASVQGYLDDNHITDITARVVRQAVIKIRQAKLPDPKLVPNSGSFFTNPVVSAKTLKELQKKNSAIPYWQTGEDAAKLSAAWLIEQAGFKGVNDPETGMSTWPTQPLVLVNTDAKTTADLLRFKNKIIDKVKHEFGIDLVQEPELLP